VSVFEKTFISSKPGCYPASCPEEPGLSSYDM